MDFLSCCQKSEEDSTPILGQTTRISCLRLVLKWLRKCLCFNINKENTNETSTAIVKDQCAGPSYIGTGHNEKVEENFTDYEDGQEIVKAKENKGMEDSIVNNNSDSEVDSERSFETHIVKAFIEDSSGIKNEVKDRPLKVINFALVNPKSMSSNFSMKLDKHSNVHLDFHNIDKFDAPDLLDELTILRNISTLLQLKLKEEHVVFELLAAPISDNLELNIQDLDCDKNNLDKEEFAAISSTGHKSSSASATRIKQAKHFTNNVKDGVSQKHLSRNTQTAVKRNDIETSPNGHTAVKQNKKKISKYVETKVEPGQKDIGQTEETIDLNDNLICHSVKKVPGDGYIINEEVQIHLRHWHCVTDTKKNLYCEVCKYYFKKDYLAQHVTAKNHSDRLQKCEPLRAFGSALVRKVDKERYHCAICNIPIAQLCEHVQSAKHRNNLQDAQKEASLTLNKNTLQKSQNIPKAEDVNARFLEVTSLLKADGGFIINKTAHLNARRWNMFTGTNTRRYCNVCQEQAVGKNGFIHFMTVEHKAKLSEYKFLKEFKMNLIRKLPDDAFYCGICGEKCDDPTAHVLTGTHRTNYEASKKRAAEALLDPSKCRPVKL